MTTITRSVTIDAPVEEVSDFVKDPAKLWPVWGTQVRDVQLTPEGVGTTFVWDEKVLGIHVTGNNEYTEFVPNQHFVVTSSKGYGFRFTLEGDGQGTKLTLAEEDVPKNRAVAAFDALTMRLTDPPFLDKFLTRLKATIESGGVA